MRILVSGASGFVGKNFQEFLHICYPKSECVFLSAKKTKRSSFGKWLKADITKPLPASLKKQKFDVVFHLAALNLTNVGSTSVEKLVQVNGLGTHNLLSSLDFGSFVFLSSTKVYGRQDVLEEDSAIPKPADDYSISKLVGELFCRQFSQKHPGKKIIVFRSVNIYGPFQPEKALIPVFLQKALKNQSLEVFGNSTRVQLIFVHDVLNAFALALQERLSSGTYHIAPEGSFTLREVAEKVISTCNSKSEIVPVEKSSASSIFRAEKLKAFGWNAETSLDEGLRQTLDSLKN